MQKESEAFLQEKSASAFRDLSNQQIEALVQSLNSLQEGELGIDMLVACGKSAIEPLRRFLLVGRPSSIFIARQRAVHALAQLGAKDALLEYFLSDRPIQDPDVAHGEEAVRNTAARSLATWQTEDVYQALRRMLRRRMTGVVEALGEFQRHEIVPELIAVLEDDFCQSFAEDALRKIGDLAHRALIDAARTPHLGGGHERPASARRRRSALHLLESSRLEADDLRLLAVLLYDEDREIRARARAIALLIGDEADKRLSAQRLIEGLPVADWLLQGEIEAWLREHLDVAVPAINREIERRSGNSPQIRATDNVLRLLLGLRRADISNKPNRMG